MVLCSGLKNTIECLISYSFLLAIICDNRAFVINGKRTLFVAGSIHYPRASSEEWPAIIETAKDK